MLQSMVHNFVTNVLTLVVRIVVGCVSLFWQKEELQKHCRGFQADLCGLQLKLRSDPL